MVSFLDRLLLGIVAGIALFGFIDSPLAAQVPKVNCQVGDTIIVDFQGRDWEATVTEVLADGAMVKADFIYENGEKRNWPIGAPQVKSVKSRGKRDSASRENPSDEPEIGDSGEAEISIAESEPDRTWTSSDGKFTVSAKLAGKSENIVRLIRSNGKVTRVEFDKLSEADRKYIEAALRKAQSETARDPFSDSKTESRPLKTSGEFDTQKLAAEYESATKVAAETDREGALDRAGVAKTPPVELPKSETAPANSAPARSAPPDSAANPPAPRPANAGMSLFVGLFLRFGFSGFIFGPLLLSGIALLAIGLKNAKLYY